MVVNTINIDSSFRPFKQPNKIVNKNISERVRRDKKSEYHDRKNHEDKTLGSVLCGLVLA
jgi:hypothetical protein